MRKNPKPSQLKLEQENSQLHIRVHSLARSTESANRQLMKSHVRGSLDIWADANEYKQIVET
jgi:hypothetical protein